MPLAGPLVASFVPLSVPVAVAVALAVAAVTSAAVVRERLAVRSVVTIGSLREWTVRSGVAPASGLPDAVGVLGVRC